MWIEFVTNHPIWSAMLQFAVLGTVGEIVGATVKNRKFKLFSAGIFLGKMLIWAILAVMIKYAFTGFGGFVEALTTHQMLPEWGHPFFISAFMNILFGPVMIMSHRFMDNILEQNPGNWKGIKGALLTLLWFWIPAHTVTFMLPAVWRITLAAVWSVVLGAIMGFFKREK
ncbi:MAG TPA: hypothetical protein PK466_04920 [Thermotogota bacterium]|nr:hypothetical protein [Thermotogota bacterium]HPJ89187.1 hypothetical protein [Thermotogota bacterium]HPR95650.1 hypothetical protein [Thermotogota bacterium]